MSFQTFIPIRYTVDVWRTGYKDGYYAGSASHRDKLDSPQQQARYDCGYEAGLTDRRILDERLGGKT